MDTYNNLTLKSVHMLKVFKIYCADTYKYLMKVDDDLYFNLDATVTHLQHRPYQRNALIGRVRSQTAPYRGSSSKWYVKRQLKPKIHSFLGTCRTSGTLIVYTLIFCADRVT